VAVVVAGAALTAAAALRLKSNIRAIDVTPPRLGTDRPAVVPADAQGDRPLNILVLGSDSREGANGFIGGRVDEGRSDTTLVLHLSADRRRALAVSIPRDSVVPMSSCTDRQGRERDRLCASRSAPTGPGCTRRRRALPRPGHRRVARRARAERAAPASPSS
jgi:anionic cell wall polymer biosynthesis LytR-Cps2A-Psr (LCP) family protein